MSSFEPCDDPLRLTRCMRCGYSLANLPAEGACPECGLEYDPSIVVFYGEGRSVNPIFDPLGSRTGLLLCVSYACMQAWNGWRQLRRGNVEGGVQLAACLLIIGVILIWRFVARREGGGNLLQCRFNSFGCLQCALPEKITGLPDPHRVAIRIWGAVIVLFILLGVAEMPWRAAIAFLSFLAIVAVGAWTAWRMWRRRRPQPLMPRAAQALAVAAAREFRSWGPTPWLSISGVSIQPVISRPGRYHLIFARGTGSWSPIDAEVDCTGEQATALWNRVCAWRAAVGTPFDGLPAASRNRSAVNPARS